jgi:hypothetical protein
MTWKLSNFSNGSQFWFKLCEISIINFMKIRNHFNHFWNVFAFFNTLWHIFFHANILQAIITYLKMINCFSIGGGGGVKNYHNMQKTLWKSFVILTWFRFLNDHREKQYNMITQMGYYSVLSPFYNFLFNKFNIKNVIVE